MKTSLYNNDGSLTPEAQLLISHKPDDMSREEWKKRIKAFKSQLCAKDIKEFERLKKNKQTARRRAENPEKVRAENAKCRAKNPEKVKAENAKWRAENPEKAKESNARWYAENPEKVRAENAKWRAENPEKAKQDSAKWRAENPEKKKALDAKWRAENPEKVKKTNANWRAENPEKLKERRKKPENKLRSAVSNAFKRIGQNKPTNTLKLLGCTWEEAKAHMESLFLEGMTWENHGKGDGKWQIDHIRPVASFSGASEEELKQMNHISNLQPLWAIDNIKKGDKWEENDTLKY